MKIKVFIILFIFLNSCITLQAQNTKSSQILDQTAAILKGNNGIEIKFNIYNILTNKKQKAVPGTILLKGNKFHLTTPSVITWFNGKTQWSYLPDNQEVNVSNPTNEELQQINPYFFINIYRQGYTYTIGKTQTYKNKNIIEINLKAQQKQKEIQSITLYIDKNTYYPTYIKITDRNKNCNEIDILSMKKGLNLPENQFIFDSSKYRNVEIIDLR